MSRRYKQTHDPSQAAKKHLAGQYQRYPEPFMFLDESYRKPDDGPPYYVVSAVTLARDELQHVRDDTVDMAGRNYWHTTEAFERGDYQRIAEMLDMAGSWAGTHVCAIATGFGPDGLDDARQTCLAAVMRYYGNTMPDVRLAVADRIISNSTGQPDFKAMARDQRTMHLLRQAQVIERSSTLTHHSAKEEPILRIADVCSWATHRLVGFGESFWLNELNPRGVDMSVILHADSGMPLKGFWRHHQGAVATSRENRLRPGSHLPGGREGDEADVVSTEKYDFTLPKSQRNWVITRLHALNKRLPERLDVALACQNRPENLRKAAGTAKTQADAADSNGITRQGDVGGGCGFERVDGVVGGETQDLGMPNQGTHHGLSI
jgi:hypothetical protein